MPITSYNSTDRVATAQYDFTLTTNNAIDVSQFNVVNTSQSISVITATANGNLLVMELAGDVPVNDFGIVYTPGTSGFLTRESDGQPLGQIYLGFDPQSADICGDNCGDPGPTELPPTSIVSAICLDANTIEIQFSRYLSSNAIPGISAFILLDVPENATGNFTQVSVSGFSLLLQHNFAFDLRGTSIQYLPPATNFLQTTDSPPTLILPFIVPLVCNDGITPCDITDQIHKNGVGTGYGTINGELATINDYVLVYGLQEAIQASNDDNGGANVINEKRLQFELNNAAVFLNNYIQVATWSGRALLAGSFKRTQLVITRYYLLNKTRPQTVQDEFERTLQWIEQTAYNNASKFNEDCVDLGGGQGGFGGSFDAFHSGGRVMTWGTTQQYRTEDGLGLRGWHLPTDGQDHLWKIQNGYYVPDYEKRRYIRGGA